MGLRPTNRLLRKILGRTGFILLCSIFLLFILHLLFPLRVNIEYSTVVTDNRGEIIHAFLTRDDKWRMKTSLEEISPLLRKTIIAKEDRYFYRHPGVNPFSVIRAAFRNLFSLKRTSGASTITMQVARALEPRPRNIWSKIIEMFRALQLEWKYSKDEILQMYLNLVPYGGNIEGVKSAAYLYFKKAPDHLSLAEITALSIIPNRPSSLVIGRNNGLIVEERNKWLRRFSEKNVFSEKEITDALAEPLNATRGGVPRFAPHLSYKLKSIHANDAVIKTHINLNTQLKIEKIAGDYVRSLRLKNIRNAAVIVIDNRTHSVVSYLGSADFNDTLDAGQVNGAAAIRQPGSTLKPLLFALCFDEGLLTPKKIMTDVPVNYEGYVPENYDQRFNGYVTVEYALEHSLNIPAVKGLRILGKERMLNKLVSCNFRQVREDRKKLGLSLILGGCGASLEELTGLFSAFANEGVYVRPSYVQTDSLKTKTPVVSGAAGFMITEILSRINRPDFPLNWQSTERMPKIAWKTGTSYGRRDAWSIGYNKNYTVGVWIGNFSGTGVPELSGSETATPLLFRIFNTIDYDSDSEWYTAPEDCEQRKVCSETGMIPADHCTHVTMDYFIPLISSTKACDNLKEVFVSPGETISYCKSCAPAHGYKKKFYKMTEMEMQSYFEDNRIAYDRLPTHNPECEKIFVGGRPQISSPANGNEYLIDKSHPEPLQLLCNTATDVSRVYWYINNRFYKAAGADEKLFFMPAEGPVKISCTDDKGRNRDIRINVRYVNL